MIKISDSQNKHYAQVTEDGYLKVCLCDKTCDFTISLKKLLEDGYKMALYVEDEKGKIKPFKNLKTFQNS